MHVAEYAKKASDLRKKADDAKKAYDNAVTKAGELQGKLKEKVQPALADKVDLGSEQDLFGRYNPTNVDCPFHSDKSIF